MTSPSTFNTAYSVLCQAGENAGLIPTGGTPNSEQLASWLNRLNQMVNHWATKGLKLWLQQDIAITSLSTTTNFYPLGPGQTGINMTRPYRVPLAYFQDSTGNTVNLIPVSWQEWIILQNKTTSPGQPVNYFVDKQATYLGVYLWPTPDSVSVTGSVHLVLQNQPTQMVGLVDTTAFPIEWAQGMSWGLSDLICTGQPADIVSRCAQKAEIYRVDLEGWDVEDAETFFTVDTRGGMYYGNFQ